MGPAAPEVRGGRRADAVAVAAQPLPLHAVPTAPNRQPAGRPSTSTSFSPFSVGDTRRDPRGCWPGSAPRRRPAAWTAKVLPTPASPSTHTRHRWAHASRSAPLGTCLAERARWAHASRSASPTAGMPGVSRVRSPGTARSCRPGGSVFHDGERLGCGGFAPDGRRRGGVVSTASGPSTHSTTRASAFSAPACSIPSSTCLVTSPAYGRSRARMGCRSASAGLIHASPHRVRVGHLLRSARQGSGCRGRRGRRGRRRRTGTRGMASHSSRESSFSTVCVSGDGCSAMAGPPVSRCRR